MHACMHFNKMRYRGFNVLCPSTRQRWGCQRSTECMWGMQQQQQQQQQLLLLLLLLWWMRVLTSSRVEPNCSSLKYKTLNPKP